MKWVAALFPLGLVVALFAAMKESPTGATIGRALCVAALLPALARLGRPLGRATQAWFALLALVAAGHVVSAVLVYDGRFLTARPPALIVMDLERQLLLCAIAALLAIQLRYRDVRTTLSAALGAVALAGAAQILYAYVAFHDVWAAFRQPAAFKLFAANSLNIVVNPLSFTVALAAALAVHAWWPSRFRWLLVGVTVTAIVISGSRSTQISVAGGAIAYGFLLPMLDRARRSTRQVIVALAICGGVALAVILPETGALPQADMYELADLTTGRVDLWVAATTRFVARPWGGWGAQSAEYDLASVLPGYLLDAEAGAGGYHSMYLGLLADKGLVGFVPTLLLLLVLARWSFALRRGAARLGGSDAVFARLAPIILVVLAVRGVSENAGFMGEARGVVDLLAYAFGAAVVALRAELEEQRMPGAAGAPSLAGEDPVPDPAQRAG